MSEPNDSQEKDLTREALSFLNRFTAGEVSEADREALRHWRDASAEHKAALLRAARLWRALEQPAAELARAGAAADPSRRQPASPMSRRFVLAAGATTGAVAAAVLLIRPPFHLWPSLTELGADHRTAIGERKHLALSPAVSVDLNTRTSITAPRADPEDGIELISGEAAVTVGGRVRTPFVVRAGNGAMEATRATFNVRLTDPGVRLTCVEGEVLVTCASRKLVLKDRQQVSYNDAGLTGVAAVDPEVETAWRGGLLLFRNTPLSTVIEEVNRYRPGRLILMDSSLGRRLVTARFEIPHIDTVPGQIAKTFNAPLRSLPGGIVLLG